MKSGLQTFKGDQNQANVAQGEEGLLPVRGQDIAEGHAVDEAYDDVADQRSADELVGEPFCNGQKEKEGDEGQDADNCEG